MVKKKELSDFECGKVIALYEDGNSERAISQKTGYGKTTIHYIIAKYNKTDTTTIAPRSGRPKILSERDKRHLKIILTQNRRDPLAKIHQNFNESTGNEVSERTIRRTIYDLGYHSHIALRKPLVSEPNRKIRLQWARERRSWTIED